jgi:putative RecB family exonuclease
VITIRDLPKHASYSQLDSWMTCGEKYWLSKATDIPQLPSWALLGGSAVHSATEELDRALYDHGVGSVPAEYAGLFSSHLATHLAEAMERNQCTEADIMASGRASKAWPEKESRAWWEHHGPAMVQAWVDWQASTPWELWQAPDGQWAIELELEATFGGGPVKLAIDRVFVAWGELCVVDIKSGREPTNQFQLGQYSAAIEQAYGVRPMYGSYWMARTGQATTPASLTTYTQDYVSATFRKFGVAKEAGLFLPHPSSFCGSCGVRDFCSAKGTRANEIPRPYMEV